MTVEKADVLSIGTLHPGDALLIEALLRISKAPLGWDGEFCAKFFLRCGSGETLPMGIVMCLQPDPAGWSTQCTPGSVVFPYDDISEADADHVLASGATLMLRASHPLSEKLRSASGVAGFTNVDELLTIIKEAVKRRSSFGSGSPEMLLA